MNIRKQILRELTRSGRSRYWLGKQVEAAGVANRHTVFRYLRGDRDTSGEIIGCMLKAVGLAITRL